VPVLLVFTSQSFLSKHGVFLENAELFFHIFDLKSVFGFEFFDHLIELSLGFIFFFGVIIFHNLSLLLVENSELDHTLFVF
jgi:hypothetical protein